MSAEVKHGYKLTEVGVIPEDWEVKQIQDLCGFIVPGRNKPRVFDGNIPWITTHDLDDGRAVYDSKLMLRVSISEASSVGSKVVPAGSVLMSCVGELGIVAIAGCDIVINQQLHAFLPSVSINKVFLAYIIKCQVSHIKSVATKTALPYLNKDNCNSIPIPVPSVSEQESIAEALSDADALIESLEQLITKKRHIKQGAMQELLTGKKRLPGFSGEWEVKRLGDLFSFSGGYSASRDQLSSEGHCYLHYGDIHGSSKMIIDAKDDYQNIPKLNVPLKRIVSNSLLEDGDVVFVDASEDDEGTSKYIVVVNKDDIPFIAGLHTIVAKSKTSELTHEYRRYCFQTASVHQQFLFFAVGTKVSGISKSNIPKLTLPFPPYPEQAAIAEILIDMDTEIDVLEVKLDKARHLKQGMMYNLLTGKIRLIGKVSENQQNAVKNESVLS